MLVYVNNKIIDIPTFLLPNKLISNINMEVLLNYAKKKKKKIYKMPGFSLFGICLFNICTYIFVIHSH